MRTLVLAAVILLPRWAAAQATAPQPLQELFFTETVYPQDKRELQLTLGARVDRASRDQSSLVPFAIEYGITDSWQIDAGLVGYSQFHSFPVRDVHTARLSVGTKYSFMKVANSHVHAAIGTSLEFPRTSQYTAALGENDGMEIEPVLAIAGDLPGHVTLFGSAASSFAPKEVADVIHDRGTISVGAMNENHRATIAAEYTNRSDALSGGSTAPLLTPSLLFHPPGKWELGVGFPIGVRGRHQAGIAMNIVKEFF